MSCPQVELTKLKDSSYFKRSYLLPSNGNNSTNEETKYTYKSIHYRGFVRTLFHSIGLKLATTDEKEVQPNDDDATLAGRIAEELMSTVHTVNKTEYDFHNVTNITMSTPMVKTYNENIRVKWTEDYGFNNCIRADYTVGDLVYDDINCHWIEDFFRYALENGLKPILNKSIGNLPELTTWSHFLPERTFSYDLPFCFSYSHSRSMMTFLIDPIVTIRHRIVFYKNPAASLLRMQVKRDNEWIDIPVPSGKRLIRVSPPKNPIITTGHSGMLEDEKTHSENHRNRIKMHMHRVKTHIETNVIAGDKRTIKISEIYPILAISVKVINREADRLNYRNNHTDNPTDRLLGKDPISFISLNYDKINKYRLSPFETNSIAMRRHFPGLPLIEGCNLIPQTLRPFKTEKIVGTMMKEGTVLNIRLKKDEDEDYDLIKFKDVFPEEEGSSSIDLDYINNLIPEEEESDDESEEEESDEEEKESYKRRKINKRKKRKASRYDIVITLLYYDEIVFQRKFTNGKETEYYDLAYPAIKKVGENSNGISNE